jgi:poly(3-hydroxybutyrate) depolymerase
MRFPLRVVLALALLSARARGDVALALGPDGSVGAWLVAGPSSALVPPASQAASVAPSLGMAPGPSAPRFRLFAHSAQGLDLERALGVNKPGNRALAAGTLRLERDFEGWLLLSVDGEAHVFVDGRSLWQRHKPHAADRSIDAIAVSLAAGSHSLLLLLGQTDEHWELGLRIVDRERLAPPWGATWLLPGAGEPEQARLVRELASIELRPEPSDGAWLPRLTIAYPRGVPRNADLTVRARLRRAGAAQNEVLLGRIVAGARGSQPLEATLPAIALAPGAMASRLTADVRVGSASLNRSALVSGRALEALGRARRLLASIAGGRALSDAEIIAATLEFRMQRVASLAARSDVPPARLSRASQNLAALCDAVERGASPVHEPGVLHLARRSSIDGRPQRLWVHVPQGYVRGADRRYPLVIALHGFNGRPRGVMRAFLDRTANSPHPAVDGFVVAPEAHGNSFYRGAGEAEVLSTLEWALATYPIDARRVSVTGVSMGGTGTAELAFLYADRFAAAAPLCGYHSYFIRRDVQGLALADWDKFVMHHFSPVSWAERGRSLPLYVAHGTKDYPLENSRVLIRRYRELGYDVSEEWPDIGHQVWEKTYDGARLWPWLSRKLLPVTPDRVTLITDSLRYGRLYWARITALETPGARAQADVRRESPTRFVAATRGVTALEIDAPGRAADAPCSLEIDGTKLDFAPRAPVAAQRSAGAWHAGRTSVAAGHKQSGLEGPISDAFLGKVAFVWGSLDAHTAAANREVAETFARGRHGISIAYPVLRDRDLSDAVARDHALFLVGTADDHLVLRQIAPRLPIAAIAGELRVGSRRLAGPEIGALFVYPDPRRPDRYVVVLTAPSVAGIYRALSLPDLLPDFIVYDARVAAAAGEPVLDGNAPLVAGFFGWDWRLP